MWTRLWTNTSSQTPRWRWLLAGLWCVYGLGQLTYTFVQFDLSQSDFRAFWEAGLRWRFPDLKLPYNWRADFNPPTFRIIVSPLSMLSLRTAFMVWTGLSVVAVVASLRAIHRAFPLSLEAWLWLLGAILGALSPGEQAWRQGQVTWILLYPMTRAYLAPTTFAAGVWLGTVIAVKPAMALVALALPLSVVLPAAITSASISTVVLVLFGSELWSAWLNRSPHVWWLSWPANASLWGVVARAETGRLWDVRFLHLSGWSWAAVIGAGIILALVARRDESTRWLRAVLLAVLLQPLGWAQYGWWALAPLLRTWQTTWVSVAALVLLAIPLRGWSPWLVAPRPVIVAIGSIYCVALLLFCTSRRPRHAAGSR